jgi:Ca2+-binding RTX toxin-like protein
VGTAIAVTILDGVSSVDITLTPVHDGETEAAENLKLDLASGAYQIDTVAQTGKVTITSNNHAPVLNTSGTPTLTTINEDITSVTNTGTSYGTNETAQTTSDYLVTVTSGGTLFTTAPDISNVGDLTYTPNGTSGTATVEVRLKDDGGTANGGQDTSIVSSFTITIAPPTVAFSAATQSGTEGNILTVTITLSNPSSQAVTVPFAITGTATNGDDYSGIPASIIIAASSTSGSFTFDITNDATVELDETIAIAMGTPINATTGNLTSQTITIGANNSHPTATADTATVTEDATTSINVLANDSIAPDTGETLLITAVGTPINGGTATINGNNINYIPTTNFNGTDTFIYTISDGNGGTSAATVTVTVNPVNDEPTIAGAPIITIAQNTPYSFTPTATFRDQLKGSKSNDRFNAIGGNDSMNGDRGNDQLKGGKGRDLLLGGKGNDRLRGDQGDDILVGGRGSDTLTGGRGKDMFAFSRVNESVDTMTDFSVNDDVIDLRSPFAQPQYSGETTFDRYLKYVQLTQVGSNTEIKIDVDGNGAETNFVTLATLANVSANTIGSRHFVIA